VELSCCRVAFAAVPLVASAPHVGRATQGVHRPPRRKIHAGVWTHRSLNGTTNVSETPLHSQIKCACPDFKFHLAQQMVVVGIICLVVVVVVVVVASWLAYYNASARKWNKSRAELLVLLLPPPPPPPQIDADGSDEELRFFYDIERGRRAFIVNSACIAFGGITIIFFLGFFFVVRKCLTACAHQNTTTRSERVSA